MHRAQQSNSRSPIHSMTGSSAIFSDLAPTFDRLRAAVRDALNTRPKAAVGARACAREFAFDKSIGWKIFQIGYAEDFVTALSAMPGARGWEIVLAKFRSANIGEPRMQAIQAALRDFEKQLADRRIDRGMLSGMAAAVVTTDDSKRQMLRLRKQASDALAVILGVHANTRIGAYICAPSADGKGLVDLAALTVFDGLERRRLGAPWELYRPIFSYDAAGSRMRESASAVCESQHPPLVDDLSSPDISEHEIEAPLDRPGSFNFVARNASRTDPLSVSFAEFGRSVGPEYQAGSEKVCELSMPVALPTAVAVLDVLLHRSLHRGSDLRAELYASGHASAKNREVRNRLQLMLESEVVQPTSLHVSDASPQTNASYQELCRRSAERLGHDLKDFECHRILVPHPPVPCTIMMWWELARKD